MNNQIIHDIIEATDLIDLANQLEKFFMYIESFPNQEETQIKKLLHELNISQDSFEITDDKLYQILDNKFAVNQYLYCCLPYNDPMDILFLKWQIDYIKNNVQVPQGARLSKNDIHEMMTYLEERFAFCTRLFKVDRLKISLINNSFNDMNSVYKATDTDDDSIIHSVFITHERKHFGHDQIYTLLHELGHVLHTVITRNSLTLPSSFKIIQEKMFRGGLNDPTIDWREIFADCFVCVASVGTELEGDNPLNIIHPDDKAILLRYFDFVMEKLDCSSDKI